MARGNFTLLLAVLINVALLALLGTKISSPAISSGIVKPSVNSGTRTRHSLSTHLHSLSSRASNIFRSSRSSSMAPWNALQREMDGWMQDAVIRRAIRGPARSRSKVHAAATEGQGNEPVSLVLGGDGFCGWPTALHLSENGHKVIIVDNLLRRKIDEELGTQSLTPIKSPEERVAAWKEVSGKDIEFINMDVSQSLSDVMGLMEKYKPDNIIHFAEIRAAPYSMKSPGNKAETVRNNLIGVHNVLIGMLEHVPDAHLIHLGTMGVYGYGTVDGAIPEGYVNVCMGEKEMEIVAPYHPGSVYHTTKCLDNVLFNFYVKNDQLRITDLHQGIVWGVETPETARDPRLVNRLDVDSDYGTVLNRFAVQSALGLDITPYGTGGQTRAFINIADTSRCIRIATENPPERGERVKIFNQVAESHRVRDLAGMMQKLSPAGAQVKNIPNPRNEKSENELEVINQNFRSFGWDPVLLDDGKAQELVDTIVKHKDRLVTNNLNPSSFWGKKQQDACKEVDPAKAPAM